jgi:hypothetical protein
MSGSADVTSGVQKKYLTVKSADFNVDLDPDNYAYLDLEFPEPLQHVHEIALQTATIPNELFNVREGQNTLTLAWCTFDNSESRAFTLTVAPGLYTLDKLCENLTTQATNQNITSSLHHPPANADEGIVFNRLESSKAKSYNVTEIKNVEEQAVTAGDNSLRSYYAIVHVATPQTPFATSIAARLGFTRNDVFTVYETPRVDGTIGVNSQWVNAPAIFEFTTLDDMHTRGNTSVFESHTSQTTAGDEKTTSMLSGTETYDAFLLHCDLLSNSTLITGHLDTGIHSQPATISRTDVLAVIPNNANIGANVVFVRPSEHYGGHAINQHRPITKMRLWLTDTANKPFRHYEVPDWVAVLEFTIVEHVPDIMRQVAQLNQNKAFQSRHMPMMLG